MGLADPRPLPVTLPPYLYERKGLSRIVCSAAPSGRRNHCRLQRRPPVRDSVLVCTAKQRNLLRSFPGLTRHSRILPAGSRGAVCWLVQTGQPLSPLTVPGMPTPEGQQVEVVRPARRHFGRKRQAVAVADQVDFRAKTAAGPAQGMVRRLTGREITFSLIVPDFGGLGCAMLPVRQVGRNSWERQAHRGGDGSGP
jgi:hypothetical protein